MRRWLAVLLLAVTTLTSACRDESAKPVAATATATPSSARDYGTPLPGAPFTPVPPRTPTPTPTLAPGQPAHDAYRRTVCTGDCGNYLIDTSTGAVERVVRASTSLFSRSGQGLWTATADGVRLRTFSGQVVEDLPGVSGITEAGDGSVRLVTRMAAPGWTTRSLDRTSIERPGASPRPIVEGDQRRTSGLSPTGDLFYEIVSLESPRDSVGPYESRVIIRSASTGDEVLAVRRRARAGGTDDRLWATSWGSTWSPSGRYLYFMELDDFAKPRILPSLTIVDAATGSVSRFDARCPATAESGTPDRAKCSMPWPWWAPGRDLMLVPVSWAEADGVLIGVFDGERGDVVTAFPPALSRTLEWVARDRVGTWLDGGRTRVVFDAITGAERGRWTLDRSVSGGYEGQGPISEVGAYEGGAIFAAQRVSSDGCGGEAFHPLLPDGNVCLDGDVEWVSWSPDGTKLAVTHRNPPVTKGDYRRTGDVAVYEVSSTGLRELHVIPLKEDLSVHSPRPHWAPDGRYLLVVLESTQI